MYVFSISQKAEQHVHISTQFSLSSNKISKCGYKHLSIKVRYVRWKTAIITIILSCKKFAIIKNNNYCTTFTDSFFPSYPS